ncbi:hypothetical protein ACET3Z_003424 [Daucus carota]
MVKIFAAVVKPMVRVMMKAYGMKPKLVEIEPGTTMRFWIPCKSKTNPAKPNIVFLHGFATDGIFNWQSQVQALSGKYSVYVPDLLFFGASTTSKPERSMEFHAECLVKGLRSFGVEKFTVAGLSYGATLGFRMARMYPGMVQCIVASGTAVELTESISRASLQNIGYSSWSEFLMPDSTKGLTTFFSIASQKPPSLPEFAAKDFLKEFFANRKERDELLKAWVINDNDVAPCHYSQKVYLIWGEDDKIFKKEVAENIKRQLGEQANLEFIKDAGHLVHSDQPSEYNQRLKNILASVNK